MIHSKIISVAPSRIIDIKAVDKYLSVSLIFAFTFISSYCLAVFGPMFASSKGHGHRVGTEIVVTIFENLPIVIIACLVISTIVSFIYLYLSANRKLVSKISFDDQKGLLTLQLFHFYTEKHSELKLSYQSADIKIIRTIDGKRVEEIKILFRYAGSVQAMIGDHDYLWDKDNKRVLAIALKLKEVCKNVEIKDKGDLSASIGNSFFPGKKSIKKNP